MTPNQKRPKNPLNRRKPILIYQQLYPLSTISFPFLMIMSLSSATTTLLNSIFLSVISNLSTFLSMKTIQINPKPKSFTSNMHLTKTSSFRWIMPFSSSTNLCIVLERFLRIELFVGTLAQLGIHQLSTSFAIPLFPMTSI